MASPIRVGFIGLSSAGWATASHLPYLQDTTKFKVVAICNTSVESAEKAIATYKFDPETKAYGSPEDIAQDPNIDLIVCSVRVDRHLPALVPSLKAGKSIYVEWPLGKDLAEAKELCALSKQYGVKTAVVGVQARFAPHIRKLKELVQSGRVGKVLSSTVVAQASNLGRTEVIAYLADKPVGGNLVTIHYTHAIDYFQEVLGDITTSNTLIANVRPKIDIVSPTGEVITPGFSKTSEDTILTQGLIGSSSAPFSFSMRGGPPFKDTPGLDWRIHCENGEIRFTAGGALVQIGYEDMEISVHDFVDGKDEVEVIEVVAEDEFDRLGMASRNVARLYEAIARGETGEGDVICTFEDAVKRQRFTDEIYKQNPHV